MLVPQASSYASGPGISFSLPHQHYLSVPSTSSAPLLPSTPVPAPRATYKAPAHKHAHHLHTIPPREKSTRTLIIDHILWVHGRTRFAQARAELGMTDRTGGPSSPNYSHRHRPENYDEEAEEGSEGEDVGKLKARTGNTLNPHGNEEEDWLKSQDLLLARSLRLRAEDLEKVVNSMLVQPPPTVHPIDDELVRSPPNSPCINPPNRPKHHLHTLPNGVRLRLALGTIINDLFARQAPKPSYRQLQTRPLSSEQSSSEAPSSPALNPLPVTLRSLHTVCAAHSSPASTATTHEFSLSYPSFGPGTSSIRNRSLTTPTTRTQTLYSVGADPSTANSPPSLRCSRHLHTGCQICVETKTPAPGSHSRGRSDSFGDPRSGQNNLWKGMPGGLGPGGGGITGWQDGSGIGSGLLRSTTSGSCLRRKSSGVDEADGAASGSGSGNTRLSDLIPRFIRLSALVAMELAMEAKYEQEYSSPGILKDAGPDQMSVGGHEWAQERQGGSLSRPVSPNTGRSAVFLQDRGHDVALRPTREWYLLLSGLLTRAVLEGYLTDGWRGLQAMECLLTVGLGMTESIPPEKAERDEFAECDPDGLPSLREAMRILFPSSQPSSLQRKGQAEEEYGFEMHERLRRFYDIPASTPDLSTHMEDLAWQYPAEPVERAAVRFCEAIARWRGKPELETTYDFTAPKTSHETLDPRIFLTAFSVYPRHLVDSE
ncbi:hypothetical protein C0993_012171 [Termitomyces sp. T159_Od127]|nr:hypothetical protein C0993_012171 [Termitomyces sp. T159_Od127]